VSSALPKAVLSFVTNSQLRLLAATTRFAMGLRVTPEELKAVAKIEANSARHIGMVNDVYSWEKEYRKSLETAEEGALLSNAVQVLADEVKVPYPAAKDILLTLSREYENVHIVLSEEVLDSPEGCSHTLKAYLKGIEYLMSGHEHWALRTPRYTNV